MPRKEVTIFELLLSCPGDVLDLLPVVKECVEEFNRLYGNQNNIMIEVKNWSTDSFPQSGGHPQELLNHQFIHKCDGCVALFANKIGTPTDQFESGTEEEIEDMIHSDKQVFLYFIERPIDPSTINIQQLEKVRKFKEKYKGMYCIVKTNEEFRRLLIKHLTLFMQKFDLTNMKYQDSQSVLKEARNVDIAITVPKLDFSVEYYIMYVKDGKDEWLPDNYKLPVNRRIKMVPAPNNSDLYTATITTHGNIGFQFKCFAKCDPQYIDELIEALRDFYKAPPYYTVRCKHPSVKKGTYDDYVWFILPQYRIYETSDSLHPFLNNYYDIGVS